MTYEDKQYRNALAQSRRYPNNEQEMWTQKEPMFPIAALRDAYERFIKENVNRNNSATDFFHFLLKQEKP